MITPRKPVLIFSSSWRSGSTLIQRFVTASGQVLVWGETGGALNALRQALQGWEQITASSTRLFPGGQGGEGEKAYREFTPSPKAAHPEMWVANLSPPYEELKIALRNLLITEYAVRAQNLGYSRFGFKETRCDLATALTFRELFPDALFAFIVRNPLHAICSIKRRQWLGLPESHATLKFYAEHWRRRSQEFRQADFGIKIRYEDFISRSPVQRQLWEYLELDSPMPEDFVARSRVDWVSHNLIDLTRWERLRLKYWLHEEMRAWGY